MVGLWVNGQQQGGFALANHTSSAYGTTASTFGQAFDFGHVNAGDVLTFGLQVSPEYVYPNSGRAPYLVTSDSTLNKDHINHTYTQSFAGETRNGVTIAPGTYVSFEDLLIPNSDLNYNDENVVFSNVTASMADPTPEPSSLALLGLGLVAGGFGVFRKRRRG